MTSMNSSPKGSTFSYLLKALKAQIPGLHSIEEVTPVTGGSINATYRLRTNTRNLLVKLNHADQFPAMFAKEAEGLRLLGASRAFTLPEVILVGKNDQEAFLVLEYIEEGVKAPDFWIRFGQQLAHLHQNTFPRFGLDHTNYIGSLLQPNAYHNTWADFMVSERLEPQFEKAFNKGYLRNYNLKDINRLFTKIGQYYPQERPSLVHGDLWSGNFRVGPQGQVVLIDPAVYYGHREMDLAMMQLFGGFDATLFQTYHEVFPLEEEWEKRLPLGQLYPLLVHVNLFGESYVSQVRQVISRFL